MKISNEEVTIVKTKGCSKWIGSYFLCFYFYSQLDCYGLCNCWGVATGNGSVFSPVIFLSDAEEVLRQQGQKVKKIGWPKSSSCLLIICAQWGLEKCLGAITELREIESSFAKLLFCKSQRVKIVEKVAKTAKMLVFFVRCPNRSFVISVTAGWWTSSSRGALFLGRVALTFACFCSTFNAESAKIIYVFDL